MHTDEPEIPDGIAVFGIDDANPGVGTMLYFDVRNVAREYHWQFSDGVLTWSRNTPAFSQHMQLTISDNGQSIHAKGTMSRQGGDWEPDLQSTYTRAG